MEEEKVLRDAVVCLLVKKDAHGAIREMLLAMKNGKIGSGFWNGYGGGIEPGETAVEAAIRELEEESGVKTTAKSLEQVALIHACNRKSDGSEFLCLVRVFFVHEWQGEPVGSPKMFSPAWFRTSLLPLCGMMPADGHWLPRAIATRKKLIVHAHYGPNQQSLIGNVEVTEIEKFDEEN